MLTINPPKAAAPAAPLEEGALPGFLGEKVIPSEINDAFDLSSKSVSLNELLMLPFQTLTHHRLQAPLHEVVIVLQATRAEALKHFSFDVRHDNLSCRENIFLLR